MTFNEELKDYTTKRERECVPEEFTDRFTTVDISASVFFGCAGVRLLAACNKCGALVYPTALDRHAKHHAVIDGLTVREIERHGGAQ